jgi:lipoate-protein ligase A
MQLTCLGWVDAHQRMTQDGLDLQKIANNDQIDSQILLYRFRRPTITLGRHTLTQNLSNPSQLSRIKSLVVRRPTGGGAILHAGGICFSLMTRRSGKWRERSEGARWLKNVLLEGLRSLDPSLQPKQDDVHFSQPPHLGNWCAFEPADTDILIQNRKLGGIAQRVLKNALLLEGYITLRKRECLYMDALVEGPLFSKQIQPISLEEILGKPLSVDILFNTLKSSILSGLSGWTEEPTQKLQDELFGQHLTA